MTKHEGTPSVGELFPPDDVVGQWVFALSATVADLGAAEALFQDALHGDAPAVRTSYLYRQVLARLYESERVVLATDAHEEVRAFVASAGQEACEAEDVLRDNFLPLETSHVRSVFGYARHRTVHHAHVGSDELRDTLASAANQRARVLVDTDQQRLYYEWPEGVISHALVPGLATEQGRSEFADRAVLAQDLLRHFGALLTAVIGPYAERVGIEPNRLYTDIRDA